MTFKCLLFSCYSMYFPFFCFYYDFSYYDFIIIRFKEPAHMTFVRLHSKQS